MSAYNATFFLTAKTNARGTAAANPVFYVEPDGWHQPGCITMQIANGTSPADQVKIAESILSGAQQFRDSVVAEFERQRTAADELAEARAEIARLRGESEDEVAS